MNATPLASLATSQSIYSYSTQTTLNPVHRGSLSTDQDQNDASESFLESSSLRFNLSILESSLAGHKQGRHVSNASSTLQMEPLAETSRMVDSPFALSLHVAKPTSQVQSSTLSELNQASQVVMTHGSEQAFTSNNTESLSEDQ